MDFATQLALLLRWICSEKASPFMDTCAWRGLHVFGLFLSSRQPVELHGLDRFLCRLGKYSRVPSCCLVPLHQPREIGVLGRVRFGPKGDDGSVAQSCYSFWGQLLAHRLAIDEPDHRVPGRTRYQNPIVQISNCSRADRRRSVGSSRVLRVGEVHINSLSAADYKFDF